MANLAAYIIRRLILLVFVILGVSVLVFAVSMMFSPAQRAMLYIRNAQRDLEREYPRRLFKRMGWRTRSTFSTGAGLLRWCRGISGGQ